MEELSTPVVGKFYNLIPNRRIFEYSGVFKIMAKDLVMEDDQTRIIVKVDLDNPCWVYWDNYTVEEITDEPTIECFNRISEVRTGEWLKKHSK